MRFRIIPVIRASIRYRVQKRVMFFWVTITHDIGYGAYSYTEYKTPKEAYDYIVKRYGTKSLIV